eukprot:Sspe_Gene.31898::Locus_15676_Transcript_1_1_Confidence_1.000_Length_5095::g.31898::m.31898
MPVHESFARWAHRSAVLANCVSLHDTEEGTWVRRVLCISPGIIFMCEEGGTVRGVLRVHQVTSLEVERFGEGEDLLLITYSKDPLVRKPRDTGDGSSTPVAQDRLLVKLVVDPRNSGDAVAVLERTCRCIASESSGLLRKICGYEEADTKNQEAETNSPSSRTSTTDTKPPEPASPSPQPSLTELPPRPPPTDRTSPSTPPPPGPQTPRTPPQPSTPVPLYVLPSVSPAPLLFSPPPIHSRGFSPPLASPSRPSSPIRRPATPPSPPPVDVGGCALPALGNATPEYLSWFSQQRCEANRLGRELLHALAEPPVLLPGPDARDRSPPRRSPPQPQSMRRDVPPDLPQPSPPSPEIRKPPLEESAQREQSPRISTATPSTTPTDGCDSGTPPHGAETVHRAGLTPPSKKAGEPKLGAGVPVARPAPPGRRLSTLLGSTTSSLPGVLVFGEDANPGQADKGLWSAFVSALAAKGVALDELGAASETAKVDIIHELGFTEVQARDLCREWGRRGDGSGAIAAGTPRWEAVAALWVDFMGEERDGYHLIAIDEIRAKRGAPPGATTLLWCCAPVDNTSPFVLPTTGALPLRARCASLGPGTYRYVVMETVLGNTARASRIPEGFDSARVAPNVYHVLDPEGQCIPRFLVTFTVHAAEATPRPPSLQAIEEGYVTAANCIAGLEALLVSVEQALAAVHRNHKAQLEGLEGEAAAVAEKVEVAYKEALQLLEARCTANATELHVAKGRVSALAQRLREGVLGLAHVLSDGGSDVDLLVVMEALGRVAGAAIVNTPNVEYLTVAAPGEPTWFTTC